jgi:hypothetical protein
MLLCLGVLVNIRLLLSYLPVKKQNCTSWQLHRIWPLDEFLVHSHIQCLLSGNSKANRISFYNIYFSSYLQVVYSFEISSAGYIRGLYNIMSCSGALVSGL